MLTDYDLALICQKQYDGIQGYFDHDFTNENGDRYSIKLFDDCSVIVHEGSHDLLNWINNPRFIMQNDPLLGGVEAGFNIGTEDQAKQAFNLIPHDKIVYVIGHSRGAPRAYIMGSRLIKLGCQVIFVTFASPRPGDMVLAATINNAKEVRSYRNYHDWKTQDWVTDVPTPYPFGYEHPVEPILIDIVPPENDSWNILRMHHLWCYTEGIKKLLNV